MRLNVVRVEDVCAYVARTWCVGLRCGQRRRPRPQSDDDGLGEPVVLVVPDAKSNSNAATRPAASATSP